MERIGRYEIRSVVGSGSFATVYEAFDPRLESTVALKVLAENWAHQPDVRARFRQEAVLLRRVQTSAAGSSLIDVFDIDETEDGRPYFVMPLATGGSLERRTQGGVVTAPKHVVPVINMLERSLATLHRAGIVHRDVKPSNLLVVSTSDHSSPRMPGTLLGDDERLILGDLGLAKELLDDGSALTIAGGTPRFMAPEQRDPAAKLDGRADLFGATAIITELLTGSPAPPADASVGSALASELRKGMADDPDDRHLSAADWGESLRRAIGPDPTARVDLAPIEPPAAARAPVSTSTNDASPADVPADVPVDVPVETSAKSTAEPGGVKAKMMALVAGVVVAAIAVVGLVINSLGGGSIDIDGPERVTLGEPILLRAEVPQGSDYRWTVGESEVRNLDLQLTPSSVGIIDVTLTADTPDGEQTTTHRVTVEQ